MGALLITLLSIVCGIGTLVCFILVVVNMFQNDQTGLGIACIVLLFVCAIGPLVAFIYGWIKSGEWGIQNIMLAWTACVVLSILLNMLFVAMWGFGGVMDLQPQMQPPAFR